MTKSALSATATKLERAVGRPSVAGRPEGVTRADIHRVKEARDGTQRSRRPAPAARGARDDGYADWEAVYSGQRVLGVPHAVRARRQPRRRRGPHHRGLPRRAAAVAADRERRRGARLPAGDRANGAGRALAGDAGSGDNLDRRHRSNHRRARKRSAPRRSVSPGFSTTCRTATGRSWNCVSCKAIRSRSPPRNLGSASLTPKCSNTALCGWRRRSTRGASHERARVTALRRRSAAGPPAQGRSSRTTSRRRRSARRSSCARPGRAPMRTPRRARNSSPTCTGVSPSRCPARHRNRRPSRAARAARSSSAHRPPRPPRSPRSPSIAP